MITIAPTHLIYIHRLGELYTFWCGAIVLSTAKAMREPDNRIKQIGSHTFFMPISKVKPLTSGTGRHNIYAM